MPHENSHGLLRQSGGTILSGSQDNLRTRSEILLLVAFCGFFFFYGLGAFGLLGADEPRYAQVAREMLNRSDWITPTLHGEPWLEKPVLYYWQAMLAYKVGGVSEKTARIPGAVDAALVITAVYLFLRRFRPGSQFEGALIAASSAGVVGFARAAATDMPLASAFTIALLAWFAWHERGSRLALASCYAFLGLGMLAKGPVAPALAAVIVFLFAAIRRDWGVVWRSLWWPGIAVFLAVSMPWYVAVQLRNPKFFRTFVLEHNLARFSTNVYHHPQPFWFYLPVFLLAVMPWAMWLIAALADYVRRARREGRQWFTTSEAALPLFLLVWMFVPIIFFSASQSKLPGYVLPAVPAAALLVAGYLAERNEKPLAIRLPLALAHGLLCGSLVFGSLMAASVAENRHLLAGKPAFLSGAIAIVFALCVAAALAARNGSRLLRPLTMLAVVISVAAIIRLASPAIDAMQSARPIARSIQAFSREPVPVALYHIGRVQEFGLEFYLDRPTRKYDEGSVPADAHILVASRGTESDIRARLGTRKVSYLTSVPAQKVDVYWVGKY